GNLATSSHLSLWRWPCMVEFGTCNDLASTTIFPFKEEGSAGSKSTLPETPVAVPLMDSSGASVRKMTLLTPLGSLKSKDSGAANPASVNPESAIERMAFFMGEIETRMRVLIQLIVRDIFSSKKERSRRERRGNSEARRQKIDP